MITNNLNSSPSSPQPEQRGDHRRRRGAADGRRRGRGRGGGADLAVQGGYAVIGASAIDEDGAVLDYDFREVEVARAIIENARRTILVADAAEVRAQRAGPHLRRLGRPRLRDRCPAAARLRAGLRAGRRRDRRGGGGGGGGGRAVSPAYDLAIIGGGINGCGIARDAAGRGLKVLLVEQGDLAAATSSASTKLIHGGLRYLEHYEFRLVREALKEREVLLAAPHIIRPPRFVLPHHDGLRPAWLLRLGLFLYDHLGGREAPPGDRSRSICGAIRRARPLKPDVHQRLRVFRLLGRRRAAGGAERAGRRGARRRDRQPVPASSTPSPRAAAGGCGWQAARNWPGQRRW